MQLCRESYSKESDLVEAVSSKGSFLYESFSQIGVIIVLAATIIIIAV
jgi:hypothetical protein